MKTLKGVLFNLFDEAEEVTDLVFAETAGDHNPATFHKIEEGDHLKIFGVQGQVVFDGLIEYKRTPSGRRIHRFERSKHKLAKLTRCFTASWIQKGWKPWDWVELFLHGNMSPPTFLRAELIKKET